MKEVNISRDAAYRLLDVTDLEGKSKADSKELYRERVGCIATGIRKSTYKSERENLGFGTRG